MTAKVRLEVGHPIDAQPCRHEESRREAAEALTLAYLDEITRLAGAVDRAHELSARPANGPKPP